MNNNMFNPKYYNSIMFCVAAILCMCLAQVRIFTFIVGGIAIASGIIYLKKAEDKQVLQIVSILVSGVAMIMVALFYLYNYK